MTLRYYIQWQHAIYRVPQAALRKLAAGDHNGFWQGTTEVRSAVYDYEKHDGWRQRGLPKGLSGCETIRTIDPSVVFFEVWEDDDYQGLSDLLSAWRYRDIYEHVAERLKGSAL